jgi:prepilin signal peptidase PulO-like enzyme (type II secretory pathway)
MEILIAVIAGAIGLLVGGVINVLADDLPARQTPRVPHYPDGVPRPAAAWPGLGAFLTGQRASPARDEPSEPDGEAAPRHPARLGWRHPLVEIVTALAFVWLALDFRDEKNLPVWFVYFAILLLITVIDIEHKLILHIVSLPACALALAVAAISPEHGRPFVDFLIGGALGFGLFLMMYLGGVLFSEMARTGEAAFGEGDVILAMLSGLILGWRAFIFASLITVFVGALGAIVYLAVRALLRRRYRWFTPLPYGPYIVIGTLIMLLFRDDVQRILRGG